MSKFHHEPPSQSYARLGGDISPALTDSSLPNAFRVFRGLPPEERDAFLGRAPIQPNLLDPHGQRLAEIADMHDQFERMSYSNMAHFINQAVNRAIKSGEIRLVSEEDRVHIVNTALSNIVKVATIATPDVREQTLLISPADLHQVIQDINDTALRHGFAVEAKS